MSGRAWAWIALTAGGVAVLTGTREGVVAGVALALAAAVLGRRRDRAPLAVAPHAAVIRWKGAPAMAVRVCLGRGRAARVRSVQASTNGTPLPVVAAPDVVVGPWTFVVQAPTDAERVQVAVEVDADGRTWSARREVARGPGHWPPLVEQVRGRWRSARRWDALSREG